MINDPNSGKTQADLVDNDFVMPKVFRGSLGVDYETNDKWKFTLEGLYTKVIKDVMFQQLNNNDEPHYYGYDKHHQQPVYSGTVDARFSNTYLLSNTNQGFRYSITGVVQKTINGKLNASLAYAVRPIERPQQWRQEFDGKQLAAEPVAGAEQSITGIQQFRCAAQDRWQFFVYTSLGESRKNECIAVHQCAIRKSFHLWNCEQQYPGIAAAGIAGVYSKQEEAVRFFKDVNGKTAQQQADEFNNYIDQNKYLSKRRGNFTERNAGPHALECTGRPACFA